MTKVITTLLLLLLLNANGYSKKYSKIYVININGMINSIMSSYVKDNIEKIEKSNDGVIIIKIDTPGGMLESMRDIVLKIMNSPVPIIGYISPEGARAASAGAFIILSCDIVVMAPATYLGAAHPVNFGQEIDKVMEKKIVNDTVAFIKGIAKKRGKNIAIASKMVTESISITEREAIKQNIADFIAPNINEIKKNIKHYKITKNNSKFYINIDDASIINIEMNIFEKILFKISHPNVAYIFLLLGIYGILAEFSSPGIGFPGVVGSICLILAFFSLNTLPINFAGLLLIFLSIILFILELKIQSSGILGIGATVSFILGSIMLVRSSSSFLRISPLIIITASIFTVGFFIFLILFGIRAQANKVRTGVEGIIGEQGYAKTDIKPEGTVFVSGERWQARAFENQQINKGDKIEVVDIKNLLLIVKKIKY